MFITFSLYQNYGCGFIIERVVVEVMNGGNGVMICTALVFYNKKRNRDRVCELHKKSGAETPAS